MAYLKKVRDLTIEDLERMRHLEVLGEEGAFLIEVLEIWGFTLRLGEILCVPVHKQKRSDGAVCA
jgi:hypothetical protein